MSGSVTWRTEPGGRLVVRESSPLVLKLFGIPFLTVGCWLGTTLAGGIVGHEMTIAGWLVLPLAAAAFLVPGLLLVFGGGRTVVDAPTRAITSGRDYVVWRATRTTPVEEGCTVDVRHEVRRTTGSGAAGIARAHLFCPVELASGRRRTRIAELDGKESEKALALAREAAVLLGIPLRDRRPAPGAAVAEAGSEDAG